RSMLQILVVKARLLRGACLCALVVLLAATLGPDQFGGLGRHAQSVVPAARPAFSNRTAPPDAERQCQVLLAELARLPELALPGVDTPELRAQLLGRTKHVPVLFLSQPEVAKDNPLADALRRSLETSPGYATFDTVVGKVRRRPELARAVFLRDGYLYTENPELAALYGSLTLSLLFRDPVLCIVRGAEELGARRLDDGDYEYTSGDERGHRAKLLLFDRIAPAGVELAPARHVDLRALSRTLGFDELSLKRANSEHLVVDASYAGIQ